ncbi:hypothetical protein MSWHS_0033 [Methanosarcina sp. WWM596]|nr:hypothetical protein MSWHS_0033 [Methanosarcina sp. WWM596]AKB20303.1 hypothetical protein MSWH1_0032 [Methanosarcina sp. WH1]
MTMRINDWIRHGFVFYFILFYLIHAWGIQTRKLTGILPYPVSGFELLFPVLFSGSKLQPFSLCRFSFFLIFYTAGS